MALSKARGGGGRTPGQEQVGHRGWGRLPPEDTDKIQSYQYLSYATLEVSSFVCGVSCFSFLFLFLKTNFLLVAA